MLHVFCPWAGLNGLDKKIIAYLPENPGFFIEAGANDGIRQSNTFVLEKKFGWTGLLVEPIPRLAKLCSKYRKRSTVVNAALVPFAESGKFVNLEDVDLMTSMQLDVRSEAGERWIQSAESIQGIKRKSVQVRGRALSEIIDEMDSPNIDFLSLDVEGYELSVLEGLDLSRHCRKLMLIETSQESEVSDLVSPYLKKVAFLSHHDILYRKVSDCEEV
jgi:FkbM family methyltransferase